MPRLYNRPDQLNFHNKKIHSGQRTVGWCVLTQAEAFQFQSLKCTRLGFGTEPR